MAVGPNTVAGVITQETQGGGKYNPETKEIEKVEIDNQTVLQKKLAVMAGKIGDVGFLCAGLTFFSLCVRVAIEMLNWVPCGCANIFYCQDNKDCKPLSFELSTENRLWKDVLETIIISISVVVCAIPEGLPLAVTISLSYSSAVMFEQNC